MSEAEVRAKFKELNRGWERPTTLHMVYDNQGKLKGAEIRANASILWKWPGTFRSRIPSMKIQVKGQRWGDRMHGYLGLSRSPEYGFIV